MSSRLSNLCIFLYSYYFVHGRVSLRLGATTNGKSRVQVTKMAEWMNQGLITILRVRRLVGVASEGSSACVYNWHPGGVVSLSLVKGRGIGIRAGCVVWFDSGVVSYWWMDWWLGVCLGEWSRVWSVKCELE